MKLIRFAAFVFWGLVSSMVLADEFRPALLDIKESEPGRYSVLWKVPLQNGKALDISPIFPAHMKRLAPPSVRTSLGAAIEESIWRSESGSLTGGRIEINGLSSIPINVIVQIDLADETEQSAILRPASPSYLVPERATKWAVASSYWKIGTIHILEGFDHLLFILALMMIVPNLWMLFKTITSFTVAHSISLALATLGVVNIPGAPTEAVIALSILFLAVEILHQRQGVATFSARYPWIVSFTFGLVHGLGFAGALAEVGLPEHQIPLALLMFNIGVEFGQLLFVAAVLAIIYVAKRTRLNRWEPAWWLIPYGIGTVAAFWMIQRVTSFML